MLKLKQIRGSAKIRDVQRETLRGLGLWHNGCVSTIKDTPSVRGMIRKVVHLISVEEISGKK